MNLPPPLQQSPTILDRDKRLEKITLAVSLVQGRSGLEWDGCGLGDKLVKADGMIDLIDLIESLSRTHSLTH